MGGAGRGIRAERVGEGDEGGGEDEEPDTTGDGLARDFADSDDGRRPPGQRPRPPGGKQRRRRREHEAEEGCEEQERGSRQIFQPIVYLLPGVPAELT